MHSKDRFQVDCPRVKKRGCYFLGAGGGSKFLNGRVRRSEVCTVAVSRISRRGRRINIGVVEKYHVRPNNNPWYMMVTILSILHVLSPCNPQ